MAIKIVPHKSGKGFYVTGKRNSREWDEFLKTAGDCKGVTSVNYRAERACQKEQVDKGSSEGSEDKK